MAHAANNAAHLSSNTQTMWEPVRLSSAMGPNISSGSGNRQLLWEVWSINHRRGISR
jgi:hypothetical protein